MSPNTLQVTLSFKPILDGLNKFTSAISDRMQAVNALNTRLAAGASAVSSALAQGAAYFAVSKLESYVEKAEDAARAQAQLEAALRRTGQYSPEYVGALNGQAKALKLVTDYSGNQISAVQRQLVSARLSRDQVAAMTQDVLDLAAQLQTDPDAVAKLVGKFFRGDAEELGRLGLKIDETKERFAGLHDAIQKFAGGQAESALVFPELHHASVEIGSLKKEIGGLVATAVGPFIGGFAHGLNEVHAWLKEVLADLKDFAPSAENLRPVGESLGKITLVALAVIAPFVLLRGILSGLPLLLGPARQGFAAIAKVDFFDLLKSFQGLSKEVGFFQTLAAGSMWNRFAAGVSLVGAAIAGWQIGSALNDLDAGGAKVSDWAAMIVGQLEAWGVEAFGAVRKAWENISYGFTEFIPAIKITVLEFLVWLGEKFNNSLGEKLGFKIPTTGLKEALGEAQLALQAAADQHFAKLKQIETETKATAEDLAQAGLDVLAQGKATAAARGKPTAAPAIGTGDAGDVLLQELQRKRELFSLETQLIRAQAEHNQGEIDRITLLLEQKKLEEELRALQLGPKDRPAALAARQGANAETLNDQRQRSQETVDLENQRQAAELAGNQAEQDRIVRLQKEKQLTLELQALGAAAIPLIKARLDADDALLAKQRKRTEDERQMSEQLGAIAIKRANIEADLYRTEEEKKKAILPLLQQEATLLKNRIALLEQELLLGADEKRRAEIMNSLDQLRAQQAQNTRDVKTNEPQTMFQSIVAATVAMQDKIGTLAKQVGDLWSNTADSMRTSMGSAIADMILKSESFKDAAIGFANAVAVGFVQSGAQMLADWIMQHTVMAAVKAVFTTTDVATHAAGEAAKTGISFAGAIARKGISLGETIFHGIQWVIRTAAHLIGETANTAISIAQTAIRLPLILLETGAFLAKAAIGALSAMASIPYVGPFLAIAAMAGILAAGAKVISGFRENGGPVEAGKSYVVGEKRAEVFTPDQDGYIHPSVGAGLAALAGDVSAGVAAPNYEKPAAGGGSSGAPDMAAMLKDFSGRITIVNVASEQEAQRVSRRGKAADDVVHIVRQRMPEITRRGPA